MEILERLHSHVQSELQRSEGRFRSLVDSTDDSIYVVDRDCRYLFMNRKHFERLGLSSDGYIGRSYRDFHSPGETAFFQSHVNAVVGAGRSVQHEYQADRDKKYFLRTLSPVFGPGGSVTGVTVISKEISERKRMEEELRALSLMDDLTGLYNRRGFFALVEQQLRIASRLEKSAVIFAVDMDGLKVINDSFGHQAGDQALRDAADMLKRNFRESDITARIGGDEFVVFMIEHVDIDPDRLIQRLNDILRIYNSQGTRPYALSLSVGSARFDPAEHLSIETMMNRADSAMYEQKRSRGKAKQ